MASRFEPRGVPRILHLINDPERSTPRQQFSAGTQRFWLLGVGAVGAALAVAGALIALHAAEVTRLA